MIKLEILKLDLMKEFSLDTPLEVKDINSTIKELKRLLNALML